MKERVSFPMPRRTFITSSILLGNSLFSMPLALGSTAQARQKAKEMLTSAEKKWIDGSTLARDLGNYFGKDFSCSESMLLVSLRYLGKPEEWVWAAAGFGGGMHNKDLCGFLTGGIMALGYASGMLEMPRKEAKELCGDLVKQYWDWWGLQAPYRCAEIREGQTTYTVCVNQGQLSAAKIEEFLESIKKRA